MTETFEGVYRNGKIELLTQPQLAENARVTVTLTSPTPDASGEDQRLEAIENLIEQMKTTQVTGGRGYLFREELYGERLNRYWDKHS